MYQIKKSSHSAAKRSSHSAAKRSGKRVNQMGNAGTTQTKKKSFTLVELMVTILTVGILFGATVPKVSMATEKAKTTGVLTDFRSFQMASENVLREGNPLTKESLNEHLDSKLHLLDGGISKAKDSWGNNYTWKVETAPVTPRNAEISFSALGENNTVDVGDMTLRVWRENGNVHSEVFNVGNGGNGNGSGGSSGSGGTQEPNPNPGQPDPNPPAPPKPEQPAPLNVPMMAPQDSWYKGSTPKNSITTINIVDTYAPTGTVEHWDASDTSAPGTVTCYLEGTKLTIAGNGSGKIKANKNSESMFSDIALPDMDSFMSLTAINGANLLDVSEVISMDGMFNNCCALKTIDVSNWNVGKVSSMNSMFYDCSSLTALNVSNWNVSNVTNMSSMFLGCSNLKPLDVSSWDTSKVTNMGGIFSGCGSLGQLNVAQWNVSSVTNTGAMFWGCSSLTTMDLSGWNTSKVASASNMFSSANKLQEVKVGAGVTANVLSQLPAQTAANITGANGKWYSKTTRVGYAPANIPAGVADTYVAIPMAQVPTLAAGDTWYKGTTPRNTITQIDIVNTYKPAGAVTEQWYADVENKGDITCYVEGTKLTMAGNGSGKIRANADSEYAFSANITPKNNGFLKLTAINGANILDTSEVTSMRCMFRNCSVLRTVDVSNWDTSNVTNMTGVFTACNAIQTLDVSNWNVGKVTDTRLMFGDCHALNNLDVSRWNTGNMTNTGNMFNGCSSLTTLNVSNWNTSKVTDMATMFGGCCSLTTLDVSSWDTSSVTGMVWMFECCESLTTLDVSNWNTSKVTNMANMFEGCAALTTLDVSRWNTSSLEDMAWMFSGCATITELNLSSWDTQYVVATTGMFNGCVELVALDISNFGIQENANTDSMFEGCINLQRIKVGANIGTNVLSQLPVPSGSNIPGADGNWYSKTTGAGYAPANIPGNKADIYVAVRA